MRYKKDDTQMMYAPIPMVPGPVTVPAHVREALALDYGPGQSEPDFMSLYHATGRCLARMMGTQNDVVIMTGEGMLALWAGLKSCLKPGDRVLSIATGVFGDGIGDMAAAIGCEVRKVSYPFNETVHSLERIDEAVAAFKPHMITAVHCDTPSGTLNPLDGMQTMTSYIAAAGSGDLATGSIEYKSIFAVGLLLFVITFFMNMISIRLVRKYRQAYQ